MDFSEVTLRIPPGFSRGIPVKIFLGISLPSRTRGVVQNTAQLKSSIAVYSAIRFFPWITLKMPVGNSSDFDVEIPS